MGYAARLNRPAGAYAQSRQQDCNGGVSQRPTRRPVHSVASHPSADCVSVEYNDDAMVG